MWSIIISYLFTLSIFGLLIYPLTLSSTSEELQTKETTILTRRSYAATWNDANLNFQCWIISCILLCCTHLYPVKEKKYVPLPIWACKTFSPVLNPNMCLCKCVFLHFTHLSVQEEWILGNIPEDVVGWWVFSLSNLGLPSLHGALSYSSAGAMS